MTLGMGRRLVRAGGLSLLCLAGLSACGSGPVKPDVAQHASAQSSVVRKATLTIDDPMPRVTGKPVLTLAGNIERHNHGEMLRWDLTTLNRLGLSQATFYDPWAKKTLTLQGVWLTDLLEVSHADPGRGVHLVALDDYEVNLTPAEIEAGGIMVATKLATGRPIPVSEGGPTRIVFVGGVASGRNPDQWIWSLKTLRVT